MYGLKDDVSFPVVRATFSGNQPLKFNGVSKLRTLKTIQNPWVSQPKSTHSLDIWTSILNLETWLAATIFVWKLEVLTWYKCQMSRTTGPGVFSC